MNTGIIKRGINVFATLLYARMTGRRLPLRVGLQITKNCNMRCSYCYVNFDNYRHIKDKTKNEMFELIDELYSYGTRWLWFLGGEPMIRDDFGKIIDYAKHKGIFCDMNSNGVLINEKNIDTVKKLDAVCISIDGDPESNDYYRGRGSYQKAINAVRLLRKNNVKVRIHSILTKRTYRTLDHMVGLSKEVEVSFNYCEVLRNKRDPEDHILSDNESEEFYRKYIEYKKKGVPIMHSIEAIEYIMKWPKRGDNLIYKGEEERYSKKSYVPCLSGDLQCFLDLDGKFYACNGTWDNGLNFYEVGFQKAWDYLAKRKCISCRCIGETEAHLLLGMSGRSIFSGLKNALLLSR